ncbi:hypothetical protein PENTCL1PPCAC_16193, partial [Pristionchus entomophagus]
DIREEVDTFMFEGHDTTTSGMAWAVWCMACNPDIQERAYREIMEVLGNDCDRDLTREDMGKLQYLERCIKESMRLYPPVPFVSRQLQEDFMCGKRFPFISILLEYRRISPTPKRQCVNLPVRRPQKREYLSERVSIRPEQLST